MTSRCWVCQAAVHLGFLVLLSATSSAQGLEDRIAGGISDSQTTELRGNVHPLARPEFDRGKVPDSMALPRVTLFFRPMPSQQAALSQLLTEQQDRSSPNYRRWLTAQEFGDRFGLSAGDLNKVVAWLTSRGFAVQQIPASRNAVTFSGTAARVSAAFHAEIHGYAVNGGRHYANSGEPAIPSALAGIVWGVTGLNDFRPRPMSVRRLVPRLKPDFTNGSGSHYLAPGDFATIYDVNTLYSTGIDGTGQKIVVVGQSDISLSDIEEFRSLMGLSANDPQIVLVPGSDDPGMVNDDLQEADLDLEWAGAVARGATLIYVNSSGVTDSLQYAVQNDLAPVISFSYGLCEAEFSPSDVESLTAIGQQANAQGQTIVASSGDSGAANCDAPFVANSEATQGLAVSMPASLPYVTAVGGTELNEGGGSYWSAVNNSNYGSALRYIPETGWNDSSATYGLAASGGGASTLFSKPFWQSGTGVPNDSARDVPDVSLSASAQHDGYIMCSESYDSQAQTFTAVCPTQFFAAGGTSAGAPAFAGIVALLNQALSSAQGNINYVLYPLASASPGAFHDVVSGSNAVPCQTMPDSSDCPASGSGAGFLGYNAGPGYDQVTGLGSVDVGALAGSWQSITSSSNFELSVSPPSIALSRGGMATAQITVNPTGGLTGTPALACAVPSIFVDVTCSIALQAGTNAFVVTVRAGSTAALLLPANSPANPGWPADGFDGRFGVFPQSLAGAPEMSLRSSFHSFTVWSYLLGLFLGAGSIVAFRFAGGRPRARKETARANLVPLLAACCLMAALLGCAGATSTGGAGQVSQPVSVQLTPQNVILGQNGRQVFTATVANSSNTAVMWSANSNLGNNSMTAVADVFTAPSAIGASQTVTLTATSAADPTKQASANILLVAPEAGMIQVMASMNGLSHSVGIALSVE